MATSIGDNAGAYGGDHPGTRQRASAHRPARWQRPLTGDLVSGLYRKARAERWSLPRADFAAALEASAARAGTSGAERGYFDALHVEDLALARACAGGSETAWDHFVREFRPVLYRAADAIDPSGGARELADSLYADLYGLGGRDGVRRSLFVHFHGRSSLATWLRAVLAQRFVDRVRGARRTVPLPEEPSHPLQAPSHPADPDRERWVALAREALTRALAGLGDRDRLRLASYYAQQMTLAQIGRVLGEHEATVSRHLTRTRRLVRAEVERFLREQAGLSDHEVDACIASVVDDAGPLDLGRLLAPSGGRKESVTDRSKQEADASPR
jgi:RNA polymerase sigma factor (sigma-70 family)